MSIDDIKAVAGAQVDRMNDMLGALNTVYEVSGEVEAVMAGTLAGALAEPAAQAQYSLQEARMFVEDARARINHAIEQAQIYLTRL